MYVYLYDQFLKEKRFSEALKLLETRLTDYGIAGRIIRLQHFTSPESIVAEAVRKGAKTIVAVGNDETFAAVLSRGAAYPATYGFLPVGPKNSIAGVLGIPTNADAADILARRRKVYLDVGWFNNRYFISQLHIPPHQITVEYDERFKVSSTTSKMELVVCNLQPYHWHHQGKEMIVHPQDGKLEAFVRPMVKTGWFQKEQFEDPSIFPFEEMVVESKTPFVVEADGKTSKETKITIKLARNQLEMIVGKERKF